ncbi:MAG: hypothetical protein DWQ42_13570 [Planctomycetota bacterium]|nr:MAG: hypothetical protein DWQ42_13570 [Planctomycetota bacterium]REK49400.1 MAG: hypothetical protein DWQ46_00175 [Planctomycetota bacterium]
MKKSDHPLIPKKPHGPLGVIGIGRLSKPKKTEEQTEETIDSSFDVVRKHLADFYEGEMDIRLLGEQESGLIVDRATIVEAEELIATGEWDLVITEDLSRIYRNPRHQYAFVQNCVDAGVRVICVGDNLDTAEENWEVMMGAAALRHGLYIPDTRRRVRRKATHAFHTGRHDSAVKFGYRKLSRKEAASGEYGPVGLRIAKLPECTSVIKAMIQKLKETMCYARVADWLDEEGIAPGPYVTSGKWSGAVVKALLEDPILIGQRRFRTLLYERVFSTGRYRRIVNPNGPEEEHNPELAHLTEEEFAEVQMLIQQITAANNGNPQSGSDHPRYRVSRWNSIFPAQHATCAACEDPMHTIDSGQLKCQNAFEKGEDQCWNHVQVDGEIARQRIVSWVFQQANAYPGFRDVLLDETWSSLERLQRRERQRTDSHTARIKDLQQQASRLADAIAKGGGLETLVARLESVESDLADARARQATSRDDKRVTMTCKSREELSRSLEQILLELAATSYEFADLMREILPELVIVPIQAIDSGLVRSRARLTLRVGELDTAQSNGVAPDEQVIEVCTEIDLFDPPAHFRHLPDCLRVKQDHPDWGYIRIGRHLKIGRMTVKRAFALRKLMEAEGLSEPYRILKEKPSYASRWRPRRKQSGHRPKDS